MSEVSMEAETQGMEWADELGRWVEAKAPEFGSFRVMQTRDPLSVEILARELRWNGTALAPATQIRCLRTNKVLWVESWKVIRNPKNG